MTTSRGRTLAPILPSALAGLVAIGAADLLQPDGRADAGRLASRPLLQQFGPRAQGGGRQGDEGSELRLVGLWPLSEVMVELTMAAKAERRVRIAVNGVLAAETTLATEPSTVTFTAPADTRGVMSVRFSGVRREETLFRLGAVHIRQGPPRGLTAERAFLYGVLGPLSLLLARRALGPRRAAAGITAGAIVLPAAAVAMARLQTLAGLPWLVATLAVLWGWLAAADLARSAVGIPLSAARWVMATAFLRIGLAITSGFGSVDAQWHTHQLWSFVGRQVVSSDAPGLARSPYPPALYAALSPLVTKDFARDERQVRLAMGLMEGLAPFLVIALMRAAGAAEAAPAAAVAMAVMPEGLLVLAKGIAANILGSFATLLLVIASLRGAHALVCTGLLALVFLSHAPVAFTVVLLLLAWWGRDAVDGVAGPRRTAVRLAVFAVAALAAWAAYYREVPIVLEASDPTATDPGLMGVRWYRLGKLAQDVVLKFGLGPAVLAIAGAAGHGRHAPPVLRRLLGAWFVVGAALGVLALVSRFPLRFEYFLTPAVAAAAGMGAQRWRVEGHGRWVTAAWALSLAIQAAIGLLWLGGRFEIISVIMESPRWPFPVRL